MNKLYGLRALKFTNCEDIHSSFVCESSKNLCGMIYLNKAGKEHLIHANILILILIIIEIGLSKNRKVIISSNKIKKILH